MRRLRWKRNYLTGIAWVDEVNEALVRILSDINNELRAKEHCQDMEELYAMLVDVVQERLVHKGANGEGQRFNTELADILATHLPLPARDTPACRDCGICDAAQASLRQWLVQSEKAIALATVDWQQAQTFDPTHQATGKGEKHHSSPGGGSSSGYWCLEYPR